MAFLLPEPTTSEGSSPVELKLSTGEFMLCIMSLLPSRRRSVIHLQIKNITHLHPKLALQCKTNPNRAAVHRK